MSIVVKNLPNLLQPGEQFPQFSLEANDGKTYTNTSFKELHLVYFYPKANTPGCTAQACSLEQALSEHAFKLPVLGVSPDPVEKQVKFAQKYNLTFPLLADTELSLAKACGVYGPKTLYGKVYDGLHRIAFLVDGDGKIVTLFTKIKTKEFAQQVNAWLEENNL
ncbi:thioredoxin-dependent thiol peroxidase [Psittacicella melopsittaci]|uniref:thioredoxin-dependent peroxiredoxin n=1 Tax=Psittacicella melopsittaci TaxID=2028576 RepID=A0A3A1Y2R6_9GAMM|nr:thioredoxin-dependent thiol peroxidase [Psittacicella melopsittaci]RIY31508.1 thioredoxin-dependent thiol peroxidase [Psittacicella melopsittaci]